MSTWWNRPVSVSSIYHKEQFHQKNIKLKNLLYEDGVKYMERRSKIKIEEDLLLSQQCLWGTSTTPGVGSYDIKYSQIYPQSKSGVFNRYNRPPSFLEQQQIASAINPGVGQYDLTGNSTFKCSKYQQKGKTFSYSSQQVSGRKPISK